MFIKFLWATLVGCLILAAVVGFSVLIALYPVPIMVSVFLYVCFLFGYANFEEEE